MGMFFSTLYTQSYFNKIITLPYFNNEFYDLIVHEDTILCYGRGRKFPNISTLGVTFTQLNQFGDTLRTNIVRDTTEDFLGLSRIWGKIVNGANSGYAATTATILKNDAWLIRLNSNLNVKYIKVYSDTINNSNFGYIPFALENGYILYGYRHGPDSYLDGFVSRTNPLGERQWTNFNINSQYHSGVLDIDFFNDSLLIFGMVNGLSPTHPIESSRTSLSLINLDGEVQQTWNSQPEPEIGYLRSFQVEEDGIILYGQYVAELVGETKLLQSTLSKISRDFSEIYWIKHFGPIQTAVSFTQLFKIEPTLDGHYIGAGSIVFEPAPNEEKIRYGWLYKFSSNGDLIWELRVPPPEHLQEEDRALSCYFHGVGILPDSSIVAGGTIWDLQTNEQFPWLVKVSNDGCLDSLNCATIVTKQEEIPIYQTSLSVYPNPGRDCFFIETVGTLRKIWLVDALGKVCLEVQPSRRQYRMELPAYLENGVYFVVVENDKGQVFRKKVVVQQ